MPASSSLKKLTVDQLLNRLVEAQASIGSHLVEACEILEELRRRGRSKPEWRQGVFQWSEEIADGKLDPVAALTLFDSPFMIRNLIGMPLEEQKRLAQGGEVTVAVLRMDGKVVSDEQTLAVMQTSTFARVIERGVVRTFDDQKRLLLDREQVKRAHRSTSIAQIRVDRTKDELIIGEVRVSVLEVASALHKLGYRVERAEAMDTASAA